MWRARALWEVASKLRSQREPLARQLVAEQGKPLAHSLAEIDEAVELFEYYAGFAWRERGAIEASASGQLDFVIREPVGVVVAIVPWNFPIMLMARKAAPALAAGNTVVVKPSEETPLATLLFATHIADHLAPGVFNIVTGYGAEVGEALVDDKRVRHIAFTGSTATGQRIAIRAAEQMKGVTLELGGKDPMIVGPDVDPMEAARMAAFSGFYNAGQCCTSTERIYVASSLYPDFVEALVALAEGMRTGPGSDDESDMGPLINESARIRVAAHVEQAVRMGGRLLAGGISPPEQKSGWFYRPTVIADVSRETDLAWQETFGPVLPVAAFKSVDEAIERANMSQFGLGAAILSHDPTFVDRCVDGLEVGNVFINDPLTVNVTAPFGGMKMSGMGRELGAEGFEAFRESKHIHWNLSVT